MKNYAAIVLLKLTNYATIMRPKEKIMQNYAL